MTSINDYYGSNWLRATDLQGREQTVIIEAWEVNEREKKNQKGETYMAKRVSLYFKNRKRSWSGSLPGNTT